jgi:hypothetical protein
MVLADTPTLGMLIGLPVGILIFAGAVFVAVRARQMDDIDMPIFFWGGVIVAVIAAGATGAAMWPWKHDYHFWIPVEGNVEKISKRLVPAGDNGMQERFVVVIDGQPYGVNDTRAALLEVGDHLSIKCKKEFEWGTPAEAHGWGCRWQASNTEGEA